MSRTTTSTAHGYYNISFLQPGTYKISVQAPGFQTIERHGVTLNVGELGRLDFVLQVAAQKESVTVLDHGLAVHSETPAVGTTIDRQFVATLPLNGRTFQSLIFLTPGVVPTRGDGQFSVNGQRDSGNYFTVDGVSANVGMSAFRALGQTAGGAVPGFNVLGATNGLMSVDAVQEFRTQSSTYSAELGRTPGGQVQIVTRSGTNQFHGAVFDYFRNDALDAVDWFTRANGLAKPELRQNDFGGIFGGPLVRDRTVIFLSYEGLRLRQPQFTEISVPSRTARASAPAPIAQLLGAFPQPNGPEDPATMLAQFSATYSNPASLNAGSIRIDHVVNSHLTLFGRFSDAVSSGQLRADSLTHLVLDNVNTRSITLGTTLAIGPSLTNESRINYTENGRSHFNDSDDFGGAVPPPMSLMFPASYASPHSSRFIFSVNAGGLRLVSGRSSDHVQRQFNLVDGLSILKGVHALKVGIDYRYLTPIFGPQDYGLQVAYKTVAEAVAGNPPNASIFVFDPLTLAFHNLALYAQDRWRHTARLALSYGLRWELNPPPIAKGAQSLYTLVGWKDPSTSRLAPAGTPVYQTTYANFAPRVGMAYQVSQRPGAETVLRGGFGIFYDLGTGVIGDSAQSFPHRRQKTINGVQFPLGGAAAPPPPPSLDPPYDSQQFFVFGPGHTLPRTYEWNLAAQQSVGASQSISASYVGAAGRELLRRVSMTVSGLNFVGGSNIDLTTNSATSDYHSFQLQFQRKLSRGLQALASYSWSHSIDIASNDFDYQISSDRVRPELNRGSSDFDVRHSFNGALAYSIPAAHWGSLANAVFRDWAVASILTARTATPVDVTVTRSFGLDQVAARPDLVSGVLLYLSDPTVAGGRRINPAAFAVPGEQRQGTLGRNALRGLSLFQLDVSVSRTFTVTESINFQLRADSFNVLNHPNFADPSGTLGAFGHALSPNMLFGVPTGVLANAPADGVTSGLIPLFRSGGPRSLQLSVKLSF